VGAVDDAFEAFFRAHQREIFGYLWRVTGDEHASYDLAQETFVRAWQRFEQVRRVSAAQGEELRCSSSALGGSLPEDTFTRTLGRPAFTIPFTIPFANADEASHAPQREPRARPLLRRHQDRRRHPRLFDGRFTRVLFIRCQELLRHRVEHMIRQPRFMQIVSAVVAPNQPLHTERVVIEQNHAHALEGRVAYVVKVEGRPESAV
jgi:hypothetical protein